ncbi:MAG TPA: PhzF family phenazine biosynthesis isomerase [Egibacteraceae bacterium]|nr:PhzF family phenazine biosynthesis isomerase [Egibacteraceae bacterium]
MTTAGSSLQIRRLAAFTDSPEGGNPAGVVVTDDALADSAMQAIAAEVGYSETAFAFSPSQDRRRWMIRYFSPVAEVSFCGHATVATGVVLGELVGPGGYALETAGGLVAVEVGPGPEGRPMAALTSVAPSVESASGPLLEAALGHLRLEQAQLDPRYSSAVSYAGARHLILVLAERDTLAALDYDFEGLRALMESEDLTTVALLWRETPRRFHARNAFPVGGVVEDPATGAAAAAFGAYLRAEGHIEPPASIEIVQGEDMGRRSQLQVTIPPGSAGITVSGGVVPIASA